MKADLSQPSEFAMPYGEFERLIAGLVGAHPESVRTRFRKLRLRPFPDNIQSGTGVRVRYDLRRTIALAAVFELNNLYVAQGHAVSIVEASWPEWCRGLIAAALDAGLLPRSSRMPPDAGPILELGCGAVAAGDPVFLDAAALREIRLATLAVRPAIILDLSRILGSLAKWAEDQGEAIYQSLIVDLGVLDRDFGWSRPQIANADFASIHSAKSFLNEGPYFGRALDLLEAKPAFFNPQEFPAARLRLQLIYRYLADPAPIDAFKREIGLSPNEHRLGTYLHFYARDMGLDTFGDLPESWNIEPPRPRALELIRGAMRG